MGATGRLSSGGEQPIRFEEIAAPQQQPKIKVTKEGLIKMTLPDGSKKFFRATSGGEQLDEEAVKKVVDRLKTQFGVEEVVGEVHQQSLAGKHSFTLIIREKHVDILTKAGGNEVQAVVYERARRVNAVATPLLGLGQPEEQGDDRSIVYSDGSDYTGSESSYALSSRSRSSDEGDSRSDYESIVSEEQNWVDADTLLHRHATTDDQPLPAVHIDARKGLPDELLNLQPSLGPALTGSPPPAAQTAAPPPSAAAAPLPQAAPPTLSASEKAFQLRGRAPEAAARAARDAASLPPAPAATQAAGSASPPSATSLPPPPLLTVPDASAIPTLKKPAGGLSSSDIEKLKHIPQGMPLSQISPQPQVKLTPGPQPLTTSALPPPKAREKLTKEEEEELALRQKDEKEKLETQRKMEELKSRVTKSRSNIIQRVLGRGSKKTKGPTDYTSGF